MSLTVPHMGPGIHGFRGEVDNAFMQAMTPMGMNTLDNNTLTKLFGSPVSGQPTHAYKERNTGVQTIESMTAGVIRIETTVRLTAETIIARHSHIINSAKFVVTDNQSVLKRYITSNLIPAQPSGSMTLARLNTRNQLEMVCDSHRQQAASEARYEELESSQGEMIRDRMISEVSLQVTWKQELDIIGALCGMAELRPLIESDGKRAYRQVYADNELLNVQTDFGCLNVGVHRAARVFASHMDHVLGAKKLIIVPHSSLNAVSRLDPAKAPLVAAEVVISPSIAAVYGINSIDRNRIMATDTGFVDGVPTLGTLCGAPVIVAPPSSLNTAEGSEAPGLLDNYVAISQYFRKPALGYTGHPDDSPPEIEVYDDAVDVRVTLKPENAIPFLGWFDDKSPGLDINEYPSLAALTAHYSSHLKKYVAATRSAMASAGSGGLLATPSTYSQFYGNPAQGAYHQAGLYSPDQCRKDPSLMVAITFWENDINPPCSVGAVYPYNLRHSETLLAGVGIVRNINETPLLAKDSMRWDVLVSELDSIIKTIQAIQFTRFWSKHVLAANKGVVIAEDGAVQLAAAPNGSIVIPLLDSDLVRTEVDPNRVQPINEDGWGAGCWSGCMLRALSKIPSDALFDSAKVPSKLRSTIERLQFIMPYIKAAIDQLFAICPGNAVLARNMLPPWYDRARSEIFDALVSNVWGNTPIFFNIDDNRDLDDRPGRIGATPTDANVLAEGNFSEKNVLNAFFHEGAFLFDRKQVEVIPGLTELVQAGRQGAVSAEVRTLVGQLLGDDAVKKVFTKALWHPGLAIMIHRLGLLLIRRDDVRDKWITEGMDAGPPDPDWDVTTARIAPFEPDTWYKDEIVKNGRTNTPAKQLKAAHLTAALFISQLLPKVVTTDGDVKPIIQEDLPEVFGEHYTKLVDIVAGGNAASLQGTRAFGLADKTKAPFNWIRTPLAAAYIQLAQVAAIMRTNATNGHVQWVAVGDPSLDYVGPIITEAALLDKMYMFTDSNTPPSIAAVHLTRLEAEEGDAQKKTRKVDFLAATTQQVGDKAEAYRGAYWGTVPIKDFRKKDRGSYVTAELMQSPLGPVPQMKLLQYRYAMYDLNPISRMLSDRIAWMCYIHTPFTSRHLSGLFKAKYVLPPFDIAYIKPAERFHTGDALIYTNGCVTVYTSMNSAQITLDNQHRMAYLNSEARTNETVDDYRCVELVRSAWIVRVLSGRGTQFIRPGTQKSIRDFKMRSNFENMLVVGERHCQQWQGVMHMENSPSQYLIEAAHVKGRLPFSYWTSSVFCTKYAFSGYFGVGFKQAKNRMDNIPQTIVGADVKVAGLRLRTQHSYIAEHTFRGEYYHRTRHGGEFTNRIAGDDYSPLGHERWNSPGFRSWLNGQFEQNEFTRTMSVTGR